MQKILVVEDDIDIQDILPWKKQWPGLRPCLSQKRSHIKKTM